MIASPLWHLIPMVFLTSSNVVLPESRINTAASLDDLNELAELASLGEMLFDDDNSSGDSIRAKRSGSKTDKEKRNRLKNKMNTTARVEAIETGEFPSVALVLKVIKPADLGAGKNIKRNSKLVVVPYFRTLELEQVIIPYLKPFKLHTGVDMTDYETLRNAGAYFLQKGDKVGVRLERQLKNVWIATYIERH